MSGLDLFFICLIGFVVLCVVHQKWYNNREFDREMSGRRPDTAPPIWPPHRPDDWGREILIRHQQAVKAAQRQQMANRAAGFSSSVMLPLQPFIPSWEAHQAAEQAKVPAEVRWAQTESGDWHKIIWGNRALSPTNTPLPVVQSMQRKSDGVWTWVTLGTNVQPEWQKGPQRMEEFVQNGMAYLRPCGSTTYVEPAHVPSDEFGTAKEMSQEELRRAGIA